MRSTNDIQPIERFGISRTAGVLLASGAALMLVFMAMHPAIHSHDVTGFFDEMERKALISGIVHGTLIGVMGVLVVGFRGFVERIGSTNALARAGLIAYIFGVAAHTLAALVNGFVVPGITARYGAHLDTADEATLFNSVRPLLALCGEMNRSAASVGVVAMSAAIVLWSLLLLRREGGRFVGALGLVCGLMLPLGMALGQLAMDVHGFTVRVIVQSVWYLALAVQLIRGRI